MSRLNFDRNRSAILAIVGFSILACPAVAAEAHPAAQVAPKDAARLRHPVAIALAQGGRVLLTANERSGSVSVVDLKACRVEAEVDVGKSLSSITALGKSDEGRFLVTDSATHRLYLLSFDGKRLSTVASLEIAPYPQNVVCDKNGRRCYVASLWSRRLTVVDLDRDAARAIHMKIGATSGSCRLRRVCSSSARTVSRSWRPMPSGETWRSSTSYMRN